VVGALALLVLPATVQAEDVDRSPMSRQPRWQVARHGSRTLAIGQQGTGVTRRMVFRAAILEIALNADHGIALVTATRDRSATGAMDYLYLVDLRSTAKRRLTLGRDRTAIQLGKVRDVWSPNRHFMLLPQLARTEKRFWRPYGFVAVSVEHVRHFIAGGPWQGRTTRPRIGSSEFVGWVGPALALSQSATTSGLLEFWRHDLGRGTAICVSRCSPSQGPDCPARAMATVQHGP
jgi:hypothetical protein